MVDKAVEEGYTTATDGPDQEKDQDPKEALMQISQHAVKSST